MQLKLSGNHKFHDTALSKKCVSTGIASKHNFIYQSITCEVTSNFKAILKIPLRRACAGVLVNYKSYY